MTVDPAPTRNPSAESVWVCKTCGEGAEAHSLAEAIAHIYGGAPTVSGRNFDAEESEEVADRILGGLLNDGSRRATTDGFDK